LHEEQRNALVKLARQDFSASDAVMSRCICTSISLLWSEEQIKEKGDKMVGIVKEVLQKNLKNA
jgi:8-amino-3,8-dideoxy-alpha-D-manno-octulosonate transaminase